MKINRRGIILISILILTLVATFFLGALIQLNPGRLRQTVHDEQRDRAAMAARAGVDYALNRFKSDINWKADANTEVVSTEELVIREDRGNVLGWIKTDLGQWAGFRIRFNFQDGAGGGDGLNDPAYPIRSPEISLNNLTEPSGRELYKGSGSNYSWNVGDRAMTVPGNTVAIISEGVVASGLDPSDPERLARATTATTRAVEGIYAISSVSEGVSSDSVLSSMDAEIRVDRELSLRSTSDNVARIRAKDELRLTGSFNPDEDAEVLTHSTRPFTAGTFQGGVENPDNAFLQINTDSVGTSSQSSPIEIPGGVYIFTEGDKSSGRDLASNVKYYDMTWNQYRTHKINGTLPPPQELPADFAALDIQFDITRPGTTENRDVITIDRDVNVVGSATGKKDISIIPERGARQKAGEDPVGDGGDPISADEVLEMDEAVIAGTGSGVMSYIVAESPHLVQGGPTPNYGYRLDAAYVFSHYPAGGYVPGTQAPANLLQSVLGGNATITFQGNLTSPLPAGVSVASVNGNVEVYAINTNEFIENLPPEIRANLTSGSSGPSDSLHIPKDPNNPDASDKTVPQDIEIAFKPQGEEGSALIRSQGDVFLGTHLSGKGGGVIAKGNVDLIGFGVDIQANASQSTDQTGKASLAIFSGDQASPRPGLAAGINISTYDERRNKYWDVDIDGAIFSEKNIFIRLGEDELTSGENPSWGAFDYAGAIIALGDANTLDAHWDPERGRNPGLASWHSIERDGTTKMIAQSINLFFDPRFLAPYIEEEKLSPTFAAVSVVER